LYIYVEVINVGLFTTVLIYGDCTWFRPLMSDGLKQI